MVLNPNANWNARVADRIQHPVYYLAIDGLATKHYSTAPVRSPAVTKAVQLEIPAGGARAIDVLDGTATVARFEFELLDVAEDITDLVATEAPGAQVGTLINRKVTLYAGYRQLVESDYAEIFVGRIRGLRWNAAGTGYVVTAYDSSYLLDGEIMANATDGQPTTLRGNAVNVYASILRGVFSTSDPDFPLDFVSVASGTTSAPTGLDLADALLNIDQLKDQRDTWHSGTTVQVVFTQPEAARAHLEAEFFRVFQAWPAISGDGLLGCRFHVPALPAATAPVVDTDDILRVVTWRRLLEDHLNSYTYLGDYDEATGDYTDLGVPVRAEDTANQSATGETIEFRAESRWLRTAYDGLGIAEEMAGRHRIRYLETPAYLELDVSFRKRALEEGDVAAVTHPQLPDLRTGERGLVSRLMTIVSIHPQFEAGVLRLGLLDIGFKRYGVIGPNAGVPEYDTATEAQRSTFFYLCSNAGVMSDGTDGYRFI